jgi:cystathionine gamma-lyase/cystathionine gamma-lyase/homocysteine desulfhydrase
VTDLDAWTRLLHHRLGGDGAMASVTPLYQNSAFEFGSPYFYTRKNNPTVAELEECMALLEGASHAVALSSGMAAIKACLELARPGQTIVLHPLLYGCSYKLAQLHCAHHGVRFVTADLNDWNLDWQAFGDVALVLFETPTNPFLHTIDISAVAQSLKQQHPRAVVVVDNTWATPVFQKPLQCGADVSVHSASKYLGGHSDLMAGIALTNDPQLAQHFRDFRFYAGAILDPFAAWLLRRSLQTLDVRLARQAESTRAIVGLLRDRTEFATVYYPTLDDVQLTGYGAIVFAQLDPACGVTFADLLERLALFGSGTGMACVTSMIAQPFTGSHASLSDDEKAAMGIDRGLVRFCIGLEPVADLAADLVRALGTELHREA